MLFVGLLKVAPLWVLGVFMLAAFLIAGFVGRQGYRLLEQWGLINRTDRDQQSQVLSSVLGLLALLMGFTFSMALGHYELRRVLVVHEANAIGTTYLRVQLLQEPYQSRLSDLLADYTKLRVQLFAPESRASEKALLKQSDALQPVIWREMKAALHPIPQYQLTGQLLATTNLMFDVGEERRSANKAYMPAIVFEILIWYALAAAAMKGFLLDSALNRFTMIDVFQQFLIVLVIVLIGDLDLPGRGAIQINQEPMQRVQASILESEAHKYQP